MIILPISQLPPPQSHSLRISPFVIMGSQSLRNPTKIQKFHHEVHLRIEKKFCEIWTKIRMAGVRRFATSRVKNKVKEYSIKECCQTLQEIMLIPETNFGTIKR